MIHNAFAPLLGAGIGRCAAQDGHVTSAVLGLSGNVVRPVRERG